MRIFTIVAMAFLFVFVGMHRVAQADEVKAKVEEMNGEANTKVEDAHGEMKALTKEAKENKVKGAMERAKGENESSGNYRPKMQPVPR